MKPLYTCPRCDGTGFIPSFTHVENGICFKCQGSGKIDYLPYDALNQDICDSFVFLINYDTLSFAQFSLWDKSESKPSFGSGNMVVTSYTYSAYGSSWDTVRETNDREPLENLRDCYRSLIKNGFVLSTVEAVDELQQKYKCDF